MDITEADSIDNQVAVELRLHESESPVGREAKHSMDPALSHDYPAVLDLSQQCQTTGTKSTNESISHDRRDPPGHGTNGRPPSLQAHESAIDFDSFSYSTLPNSAPPDVLARWRHLRIHSRAHALGIGRSVSDTWGEETCCKQLLRRRIVLFLVVLLTGFVMASVAIASVWLTGGQRHGHMHATNDTDVTYSS